MIMRVKTDFKWAPQQKQTKKNRRGKGEGGEWREKGSAIEVDVGVSGAKSEIKVENRRGHE